MILVAMVTRRLKEGKTYEDFRKAWFHTVGFGTPNKMYTAINAFDPREVVVIGLTEMEPENLAAGLRIDVEERLANPLDDVIEPEIVRKFAILVSEDDFSATGAIDYVPASIAGEATDLEQLRQDLEAISQGIEEASQERDRLKKERS
jgi:hypothetical protein